MQVYRQEESLAVRMMYKFFTLSEHFTLFRTSATHGNRLPDDLRLSPLREVSTKKQCKPEASNAEPSEEVCHQGWRFTLHIQGWTQAVDYRGISAAENNPGLPCRQARRALRKGQNPPEDCIKVCYQCYYKWFSNTLNG